MAGRKKTTFAKLDRETKQRERRIAKQMRKDARKLASAHEADQATGGPQTETDRTPNADDAGS